MPDFPQGSKEYETQNVQAKQLAIGTIVKVEGKYYRITGSEIPGRKVIPAEELESGKGDFLTGSGYVQGIVTPLEQPEGTIVREGDLSPHEMEFIRRDRQEEEPSEKRVESQAFIGSAPEPRRSFGPQQSRTALKGFGAKAEAATKVYNSYEENTGKLLDMLTPKKVRIEQVSLGGQVAEQTTSQQQIGDIEFYQKFGNKNKNTLYEIAGKPLARGAVSVFALPIAAKQLATGQTTVQKIVGETVTSFQERPVETGLEFAGAALVPLPKIKLGSKISQGGKIILKDIKKALGKSPGKTLVKPTKAASRDVTATLTGFRSKEVARITNNLGEVKQVTSKLQGTIKFKAGNKVITKNIKGLTDVFPSKTVVNPKFLITKERGGTAYASTILSTTIGKKKVVGEFQGLYGKKILKTPVGSTKATVGIFKGVVGKKVVVGTGAALRYARVIKGKKITEYGVSGGNIFIASKNVRSKINFAGGVEKAVSFRQFGGKAANISPVVGQKLVKGTRSSVIGALTTQAFAKAIKNNVIKPLPKKPVIAQARTVRATINRPQTVSASLLPRTKIKTEAISKQSLGLIHPKASVVTIQAQKARQSNQSRIVSKQLIGTQQGQKIRFIEKTSATQRLITKPSERFAPLGRLKQPSFTPKAPPGIFGTIRTEAFSPGKPRKRIRMKKKIRSKTLYSPQLYSILTGVRGKKPKVLTGLEIRPIIGRPRK